MSIKQLFYGRKEDYILPLYFSTPIENNNGIIMRIKKLLGF